MTQTITVPVKFSGGLVDVASTLAACEVAINSFASTSERDKKSLTKAVMEVFDNHVGATIKLPDLAGLAAQNLKATPANFTALTEKIKAFVRENAGEGGLFSVNRGRNGGVKRLADDQQRRGSRSSMAPVEADDSNE